jgi:hypothetical protein
MYIPMVALLMFILPTISVIIEALFFRNSPGIILLIGKWFVFWGVGVRLFTAGLKQTLQPEFTAQEIFKLKNQEAIVLIKELGFTNIAVGVLGISTIFNANWVMPAAIAGGLFYGFAGFGHILEKKNLLEKVAMYSDLFMFAVMTIYFALKV